MSDRSLIGLLRRHHMWIPLLPVTMAMAVLLAGAVLDRTVDAFDGQGLRANATVLNARTAEMQGPDGMPTPRYRLLVRFLPARGDAVEAWHDVSRAVFDSATVGQILPRLRLADLVHWRAALAGRFRGGAGHRTRSSFGAPGSAIHPAPDSLCPDASIHRHKAGRHSFAPHDLDRRAGPPGSVARPQARRSAGHRQNHCAAG